MPGATIARPPIAHERLKLSDCGQVVYELKTPYRDGTTHVVMSPLATAGMPEVGQCREQLPKWMQRLAALIPGPRLHLIRYHGILAPIAKWRSQVVPKPKEHDNAEIDKQEYEAKRSDTPWARLLKRVFALDLEHCPTCNGPLTLSRSCASLRPRHSCILARHCRDRTSGGDREDPHAPEPQCAPAAAISGALRSQRRSRAVLESCDETEAGSLNT
jgi:hypothetical protein